MISKHTLNLDLSRVVYDTCQNEIKTKECYINIYKTIDYFRERYDSGEWKIAYGYFTVMPSTHLMARHCFIVNDKGEAIDPTLLKLHSLEDGAGREYISFAIFKTLDTYLESVSKNQQVPDLIKPLKKMDNHAFLWAYQNKRLLIG